MKGITQDRIDNVKDIDLIQYLQDRYQDKFRQRKTGEMVLLSNKSFVVYKDHAYDFGEVKHPYKDSIFVEQMLSGCTFMEAVERLEVWKKEKDANVSGIVSLDLFDNLKTDIDKDDSIANNSELMISDDVFFAT